jgi:hypothetical protein
MCLQTKRLPWKHPIAEASLILVNRKALIDWRGLKTKRH